MKPAEEMETGQRVHAGTAHPRFSTHRFPEKISGDPKNYCALPHFTLAGNPADSTS